MGGISWGDLGTNDFAASLISDRVAKWTKEVKRLAEIAESQPQTAFAAFVHRLVNQWTYHIRVSAVSSEESLRPL